MLTIEGEDQVTLKVTVAEVSRQVLKQLGFNGSIGSSTSSNGFEFSNPSNLGNAISTASKIASGSIGSGSLNFASYLNAMEQAGVVRTLAEPSLTAISGEQAKFYVGEISGSPEPRKLRSTKIQILRPSPAKRKQSTTVSP